MKGELIMELKFYVCKHCGNIVTKLTSAGVPIQCCGEPMKLLEAGGTDAAVEKHVPSVTVEGNLVKAVVGSVVNMAQETGTLLMRMSNLSLLLSKPDCGVEDIHKVMSLLKLTMNNLRAAFAGKDDGFDILTHNFAGLPEIMNKLMSLLQHQKMLNKIFHN